MNPELPPNPQAELESRLTAYLLGELPPHEAAAMRQVLDEDAQLAALCERLRPTIKLVREAAANADQPTAVQPSPLKLSEERRQKLLAHFKTIAPKEFDRPQPRKISWLVPLAAAACVMFSAYLLLPTLAKSKSRSFSLASEQMIALRPRARIDAQSNAATFASGTAIDGDKAKQIASLLKGERQKESYFRQPAPASGPAAAPLANNGQQTTIVLPSANQLAEQTPPVAEDLQRQAGGLGGAGGKNASDRFTLNGSRNRDSLFTYDAQSAANNTQWGAVVNGSIQRQSAANSFATLNDTQQPAPREPALKQQTQLGATLQTPPIAAATPASPLTANYVPATGLPPGAGTHVFSRGLDEKKDLDQTNKERKGQSVAQSSLDLNQDGTNGTKPQAGGTYFAGISGAVGDFYYIGPDGKNVLAPAIHPPTDAAGSDVIGTLGVVTGVYSPAPPAQNTPPLAYDPSLGRALQAPPVPSPEQLEVPAPRSQEAKSALKEGAVTADREKLALSLDKDNASAKHLDELAEATKEAEDIKTKGQAQADVGKNASLAEKSPSGTNAEEHYTLNIVGYVNIPFEKGKQYSIQNQLDTTDTGTTNLTAAASEQRSGKPTNVELVGLSKFYANKKTLSVVNEADTNAAALPKVATPAPEPQPEIQTSDNSFSTFSLNVSDVSYKLAAASLEKGVMPDPASIRSEEFINAFDYRDPDPAPGAPIGFAWERAHDPFAQNRDLVRFSVKTAAAGRQSGRPLNIVLLLDNSGSMERADRVQIIHEALRVLASQLQPQDTLSVVAFARTARLWVDGVSGSQAGAVAEQVAKLTPQGGTNLEEAMKLAYETARRHYLANGINRVVLLTDGAANLGNVDPSALKQKVEENRQQGIALDCFGIGWEGYNDDLLEVLSRHGDGRYGFLNTPEEAATDFASQLAGALRVAASDVKVQVEFNPKRVTAYRQVGYARHQLTKEQFRDNTVDAAEIGAAESGNALYVVAVNPAGEGPLGTVRVRYKVPGTSDFHEHEWELPYTANVVSLEEAGPAMRLAATASAFSEWLADSPYATEVSTDALLAFLRNAPQAYGADTRPAKLEWMIRQAKSISGK